MNTNFKVVGLTRFGIKAESTAPEVDALFSRPSELLLNLFLVLERAQTVLHHIKIAYIFYDLLFCIGLRCIV